MKDRDLLAYSLLRLGRDDRPEWMRSIGVHFDSSVPRRLVFHKKIGSAVAHPSASYIAARTVDAMAFIAEQCSARRCTIET